MAVAILNLHAATIPPTKLQLNPTYGIGGDVENVKINDVRNDDGQQAMA